MKKYDPTKSLKQMFHTPNNIVIPFYVLLLVLLSVFIILTPVKVSSSPKTPEAEFSQIEPSELPTILIYHNGSVYYDNLTKSYEINDISNLHTILSTTIKDINYKYLKKVLLKADGDVEFGRIQNVLKEIKKADVDIIGLITKRVVQ